MFITELKVLVFQCSGRLSYTFSLTVNCAAFQVKNVSQPLGIIQLSCIFHEYYVYLFDAICVNSEHT